MVVTFCGHSSFIETKEYEKRIISLLQQLVGDKSADIYLGGYGNFDSFAYECCKKYKITHQNISILFITPYITESYQKNHLEYLKEKYDEIIYPGIEKTPLRFAITYRNKWMVDKADSVICYISQSFGGAYKTYQYAVRKKKAIYNIVE